MTHRYYYEDAYKTSFQAQVLEQIDYAGQQALVLDGTYFYPTSGGQPFDLGRINGSNVVEVLFRSSDSAILHVVDQPVQENWVAAEINWTRRFDHMQQHTGQHILSQAFLTELNAGTVGFHMGEAASTIDLDISKLDEKGTASVERLANQVVWENRTIELRTVSSEDAADIPMRKQPPLESDTLRLVTIPDFDVSACGGTHVHSTGEVGIIKVLGWERRRGQIRVEFVCGNRALLDYRAKNHVIRELSAMLTTGYWELESSVSRQIEEVSTLRRQLRKSRKAMIDLRVADILNEARGDDSSQPLVRVFTDVSSKELRIIANQLALAYSGVSLLACVEEKTSLVFARGEDSKVDMNVLIKEAFLMLGSGSGGGMSQIAQGSTDVNEVALILATLETLGEQL